MMQAWGDYLEQLKSEMPEVKPTGFSRGATSTRRVREPSAVACGPIALSREQT